MYDTFQVEWMMIFDKWCEILKALKHVKLTVAVRAWPTTRFLSRGDYWAEITFVVAAWCIYGA